MPTYDYECRECGQSFEFFQRISEAPKTVCPACGKPKLERLIGPGAGFLFKGSGFYVTDYRSSDYKAKAKAESGTPPAASSSPAGGPAKTDGGKSSKVGAGA